MRVLPFTCSVRVLACALWRFLLLLPSKLSVSVPWRWRCSTKPSAIASPKVARGPTRSIQRAAGARTSLRTCAAQPVARGPHPPPGGAHQIASDAPREARQVGGVAHGDARAGSEALDFAQHQRGDGRGVQHEPEQLAGGWFAVHVPATQHLDRVSHFEAAIHAEERK